MADSEVRQKFEAWKESLPRCIGYHGGCDGDPEGMKHAAHCPMSGKQFATHFDAFEAGMRAGEIARWIPVEEKLPGGSGEYLIVESGDTEASSADFFIELPNVEKSKWMTVRSFGQDCEERELFNVTHWQPLPAAPEEKKPALSGAEESKKRRHPQRKELL